MSYRKHLMTSDEPPSELYKAVELGTNLAEVGMDCISRQAAIDIIRNHWSDFSNADNYRTAKACVDAVPSIRPKRGKWIPDNNNYIYEKYVCSECKNSFKVDTCMGKPKWNFCPNCGADMSEVTE